MASGTTNLTLRDLAAQFPDGQAKQREFANMLAEENPIVDDIPLVECNHGTTHISSQLTGLPEVAYSALYEGVKESKSERMTVTDVTATLEGKSLFDSRITRDKAKINVLRQTEDQGFLEAMTQRYARALFYDNTHADQRQPLGLFPRYSEPSSDKRKAGYNLINGGGTSSDGNCSIALVRWGENTIHGIYPEGTPAGLDIKNRGEVQVTDPNNNGTYWALETDFAWTYGLAVKDWRYAGRICNIDVGKLQSGAGDKADLVTLLITLCNRVKDSGRVKSVLYCTETIFTALELQLLNKGNVHLNWSEAQGQKVLTFRGIPLKKCEQLLETEPAISFS